MSPWETPPTGATEAARAALAAGIPTLLTERLRLDAPTLADFPLYAEIEGAEDEGARMAAFADYEQMVASWLLRGYGLRAIRARSDGTLLGFAPMDHERGDPEPEIGWFLREGARGRGYAAEAGRALVDEAERLGIDPVAYIGQDNAASQAVAARLGMARDAAAEAEVEGATVWRHRTTRGAS